MTFQRGMGHKLPKKDDVVPTVRVIVLAFGPGGVKIKDNISRSVTAKNTRVSDVMTAIEKALFTE